VYARFHNFVAVFAVITAVVLVVLFTAIAVEYRPAIISSRSTDLIGWQTNTSKTLISIDELTAGGPSKDDIPAINAPNFEKPFDVLRWLPDREPVISVTVGKTTKAYPLQILIWHEIINDRIEGVPIAVTFCPLTYSPLVFKRTVKGRALTFGVTGFLRNSGLIMYDSQTESFWQQFTGVALVGDMAGRKLEQIPSLLISFGQFTRTNKNSKVLSRQTGYERPYGENPYVGYDDASGLPVMFTGEVIALKGNRRKRRWPPGCIPELYHKCKGSNKRRDMRSADSCLPQRRGGLGIGQTMDTKLTPHRFDSRLFPKTRHRPPDIRLRRTILHRHANPLDMDDNRKSNSRPPQRKTANPDQPQNLLRLRLASIQPKNPNLQIILKQKRGSASSPNKTPKRKRRDKTPTKQKGIYNNERP